MPFTLSPDAKFTAFDDEGVIVPGGKLYTYAAGGSTPIDTYLDSAGTVNTNPIILDAAGRAVIYLGAFTYKFVLKDATNVEIWSQDNVSDAALTAVAGDLVGTTDTQTLSNKTLSAPTINAPVVTFGSFTSPTIITPSIATPTFSTLVSLQKRLAQAKGANVVAASELTL